MNFEIKNKNFSQRTAEELRKSNNVNVAHSGVFKWIPTDSEENYIKQSREFKKKWDSTIIEYDLNSYGHRCEEIHGEDRESMIALGCSNTFGLGMPNDSLWSTLLSKHLGIKNYNLGVAGGSLDSAFRVYNEWQPILKSKYTFIVIPVGIRKELGGHGDQFRHFGTWSIEKELNDGSLDTTDFISKNVIHENSHIVNIQRNLAAIENIANKTDSKLIVLEQKNEIREGVPSNKKARDNIHPGHDWHHKVFQKFIEKI